MIIQVADWAIGEHTIRPAFQKTLQKFLPPWDRRTESLPDLNLPCCHHDFFLIVAGC